MTGSSQGKHVLTQRAARALKDIDASHVQEGEKDATKSGQRLRDRIPVPSLGFELGL